MRLAGPLVAAVLAAAAVLVFARCSSERIWDPDGMDYAQQARELAEGRGFSTRQVIYNLHLKFLKEHDLLQRDWPNLHRFPLPVVLIAACDLVFGAGRAAVLAYGALCTAATAALLFLWARAWFGAWPAVAAVAVFALCAEVLKGAVGALAEPPAMLCFTAALYFYWRRSTVGMRRAGLWIGLALGLAALARTNLLFVVPVFLVAERVVPPMGKAAGNAAAGEPASRGRRWIEAAATCLGVLLAVAPWLVRNQIVAGSPLFSLHSYFLLPAAPVAGSDKWDLTLPWVQDFVSPLRFLREHPGFVWNKWCTNLRALVRDLPRFGGTWGVALVAVAACGLRFGPRSRTVAALVVAAFALSVPLLCLTDVYFDKYYFHFLPALILLAVGSVWSLLQRVPIASLRAPLLAVAALALAGLPNVAAAAQQVKRESHRMPADHLDFIRKETRPDAVIYANPSFSISWETGRRSIRIHLDRGPDGRRNLAVFRFHDEYVPLDGVYLDAPFLRIRSVKAMAADLLRNPRTQLLFPKRHRFPDGSLFLYR